MINGWVVWEGFRNGTAHGEWGALKMFRTRAEAEAFVTALRGTGRYFTVERHYNKNHWAY